MNGRELARVFFEDVFSRGLLERCDEIAAVDYVEHALMPFGTEEPGLVHGPDHLKTTARWLRAQFPDIRMTVEHVAEEGDMVAILVTSEGTNSGMLNGVVPATGRRFSSRQSHWFLIRDGRLTEHWATRDDLSAMMQLGVVHAPTSPQP